MVEEATVLGAEHSLDDMIRQFIDRHRLPVQNTAPANLVAITVKKGDGIIVLRAPVLLGFLKGWQRQHQHQHGTGDAERKAFVQHFHRETAKAAHAKTPGENRDVFPPFAQAEM